MDKEKIRLMNSQMKKRAICILGMHRSGTSAVARAINLLGPYIGRQDKIMPPDKDENPEGYWEHLDFYSFHERLLEFVSRSWQSVAPLPDNWWKRYEISPFRRELREIVEREFGSHPLWFWKDPRTALVLPLWKEVLEDLNIDTHYVLCVRNPLDVAASLAKRNLPKGRALVLWLLYTLQSCYWTNGSPRAVVSYDLLLTGWEQALRRLWDALDLPWPADALAAAATLTGFLKPALRHSHSGIDALVADPEVPEEITSLYRRLLEAENNPELLDSEEFMRFTSELYRDYPAVVNMMRSRIEVNIMRSRIEWNALGDEETRVLETDWQRFLPWMTDPVISYEHLHRYRFAAEFVGNKRVLDIACGEGYGSAMLAETAAEVVGIDSDPKTVQHASSKYVRDNISFAEGSMTNIPITGERLYDVIVCLEAIEHIDDHDALMREIKRLLKDDGLLIVSTPNKYVYSDRANYHNEFHRKELYYEEFMDLLNPYFSHITWYGQKVYPASTIFSLVRGSGEKARDYAVERGKTGFRLVPEERREARYLIALCSNEPHMAEVKSSSLVDISESLFREKDSRIENLYSEGKEKDKRIVDLYREGKEKDKRIVELYHEGKEKDKRIAELYHEGEEKDLIIESARSLSESPKRRGAELEQKLNEKDALISQLNREFGRLRAIENSVSWRMLLPVFDVIDKKIFPFNTRRGKAYWDLMKRIRAPRSARRSEGGRRSSEPDEMSPLNRTHEFFGHVSLDDIQPLEFPTFDRPLVSVIIPVFNKWPFTYYCLKSILGNTTVETPYEVLVADDGSSDETTEMLARVKGIRVLRNETNLGFLRNCNSAVKSAKGGFILFLNNDTSVGEDWLLHLTEVMKDDSVGAVGAKLIFPDGTLQEAGSIIWNDGSTAGYGRGENPERPEFCYLRDVDYCSGACLLVRKDLFLRLGGFDEVYSTAYYEDADICLAVRSKGYRVVYEPRAEVIHYESVSSSREKAVALCLENRERFVRKWPHLLSGQYAPGAENIMLARDVRRTKRVLVVDDTIPASHLGSGFPRTNVMLRCLADFGYRITFLPATDRQAHQPYTGEFQSMGIEMLYGEGIEADGIIEERKGFYNIVIVSRPHNAARFLGIARGLFPDARIIYDAEALYAVRDIIKFGLDGVTLSEQQKREKLRSELDLLRIADTVVVVSEYERRQLAEHGFDRTVIWGYPVDIKNPERSFAQRKNLLFVGGFLQSPSPNEDAMLYFSSHIFPAVHSAIGCRLTIAGTNYLSAISDLSSDTINVTGYVEQLRNYYERSRIFVVPTRYAAGIPLKLLEAMSYGLPSVVTPLIALQLGLSEGEGILIGKDDDDFGKKVIRLYNDETLWNDLQAKALSYVRRHHDKERMAHDLLSIVEQPDAANALSRRRDS